MNDILYELDGYKKYNSILIYRSYINLNIDVDTVQSWEFNSKVNCRNIKI